VPHDVLNARQDQNEAELISQAGQGARVTVSTNMAGRGTDIRLAAGVAERGGLHVILTEFHESSRVDRQLFGRCGRQGDPGSFEAIVSADDDLFKVHSPRLRRLVQESIGSGKAAIAWKLKVLRQAAQQQAERTNSRMRRQNLRRDRDVDRQLAFAGRSE
jgi:preprotein translocase subunit SecA